MHRSSKIPFMKNCTWWPFVTLTWFWSPMMFKMLSLCIRAQKNTFWKCALDDLWRAWPPPPSFKLTKVIFKYHHYICLKIPEILRYYMIFYCRLTSDPAGAGTCTLFSVIMLFIQLHTVVTNLLLHQLHLYFIIFLNLLMAYFRLQLQFPCRFQDSFRHQV